MSLQQCAVENNKESIFLRKNELSVSSVRFYMGNGGERSQKKREGKIECVHSGVMRRPLREYQFSPAAQGSLFGVGWKDRKMEESSSSFYFHSPPKKRGRANTAQCFFQGLTGNDLEKGCADAALLHFTYMQSHELTFFIRESSCHAAGLFVVPVLLFALEDFCRQKGGREGGARYWGGGGKGTD